MRGPATHRADPSATPPGSTTFRAANLVERTDFPDGSFDYAACLFSTLGMVRGAENRGRVVANAFRLLKPGGRFVLHVHNRFFHGLGRGVVRRQLLRTLLGRADAGDVTMPQAYGGAPLTLHHFTRGGALRVLTAAGFRAVDVRAVGVDGEPARGWSRVYGYLLIGDRPA
ncbi:MAG TPA: methyltransferase domain-containing protein [Urbifossiella sp.]|nr:methyltransferase domain-containing protein [Urbifossiella sp.]